MHSITCTESTWIFDMYSVYCVIIFWGNMLLDLFFFFFFFIAACKAYKLKFNLPEIL